MKKNPFILGLGCEDKERSAKRDVVVTAPDSARGAGINVFNGSLVAFVKTATREQIVRATEPVQSTEPTTTYEKGSIIDIKA